MRNQSATANFTIDIPELERLQELLSRYPSIATPIMTKAVSASQAVLAKNTTARTVPVKTRVLIHSFEFKQSGLQARYYPTARYAKWVNDGTDPHVIYPKSIGYHGHPGGLGDRKSGFGVYNKVNHPGTKPNPFMERIRDASQKEISGIFLIALDNINKAIAREIK